MSTPKLSEVFREALAHLSPSDYSDESGSQYTCCAISRANHILRTEDPDADPADYDLADISCGARQFYPCADVPFSGGFIEFLDNFERQSARFLWLCMLAEIAESEGN
jgi:hypothetical protein